MATNIEVKSAAQLYYLADLHQLDDVKQLAAKFIDGHFQQVQQSDGWTQFITSVLLEELFIFSNKRVELINQNFKKM